MKLLVCIISVVFLSSVPVMAQDQGATDVVAEKIVKEKPEDKAEVKEVAKSFGYDYQKMHYAVYAGGINAVDADMELDYRQKERYSIKFGANTRGILGALVPWHGIFETQGWADAKNRTPETHESIAMWRHEREVKTYHYNKNGDFEKLVVLYEHKKPKTQISDEALTKGTTDALTAAILVMEQVADGGKCEGSKDVFDGMRRYTLVFNHKGFVDLKKSRYNAYSGLAAECSVEVKPVAGAWYKKPRGWLSIQEQGRERGTMPTVWLAQVTKNAVAVPVRVRVKTAYGTLFMHMKKYESGNLVLSSSK